MSRHASELCILLVDDIYGELTSRVFSVLLTYGRLSFSALLHYCGLTPRQLKHSLAVLIQQHLVLWFTSPEDNGTVYESNLTNAYALLRSGKYIKTVEDRYGEIAGGVISNLLLLGHVRVGDLAQAYLPVKRSRGALKGTFALSSPSLPRGFAKKQTDSLDANHGPTVESLHQALCDMLQAGLISAVNESHFRSAADNRSEAEKEVPFQDRYVGKLKKEHEAEREEAISKKLGDWKYGTSLEKQGLVGHRKGIKRPLEILEETSEAKRLRFHSPLTTNGTGESGQHYNPQSSAVGYLDDNLILRVNHDKFAVIARSKRLVDYAEQRIGTTTSKVYAGVLRKLESKLFQCRADPGLLENPDPDEELDLASLPQVSTDELAFLLDESTDLSKGIGSVDPSQVDMAQFDHPKKRRKKELIDRDDEVMVVGSATSDEDEDEDMDGASPATNISDVSSDSEAPDPNADYGSKGLPAMTAMPRLSAIRQHLLLLASHPPHFLHRIPATPYHPERWAVAFGRLTKHLLSLSLTQIIAARFGALAARLARILDDKGKLDEKALTALGLVNQKSMRSLLTAMHRAGHIELQEIPRDTQRQPSRTIYLWYFDPERCKAKLLDETYKSMTRALQRAREERKQIHGLVEKASRTDVVGKEDELLGEAERRALGVWRGAEEKILGEVGRLDDLVGLFRDF